MQIFQEKDWDPRPIQRGEAYWLDLSKANDVASVMAAFSNFIGDIDEVPDINLDSLSEALGIWLDEKWDRARAIYVSGFKPLATQDLYLFSIIPDILRRAQEWHALQYTPFKTPQDWYKACDRVKIFVFLN